ncbi:hypothetical protein LTR92_007439 [Exophiala xenobiotica]|nr:hypothetical protein LTR92_007439 [Exophiala xenobiotica]
MDNICIPMHLDAFVLSPPCCDEKLRSKVAPYTQPNYTALRLDSHLLQHDILDHTDFHNTQPATRNPRTADIGLSAPNNLKLPRMGVHLQWSLPRLYRTATASGKDSTIANATGAVDPTQPVFKQIPNRWMITRHLKNTQRPAGVDEFQSWVVESNAYQTIQTISSDTDLESGIAPFVCYQDGHNKDPDILNAQSEIFLGQKFDLAKWPGTGGRQYLPGGLTTMTSSNPLFADYALHNTNVLSIIDNFSYPLDPNDGNNPKDENFSYLREAHCDYFVIGWHAEPDFDPLHNSDADLTSRLSALMLELSPELRKPPATEKVHLKDRTDPTRCLVHGTIYDVKYNFDQLAASLVEDGATKFTDSENMEPLSIGTTPLDAILTFLEAHQDDGGDTTTFGTEGGKLAKYIIELSQFLYAAADQYDARVQAQDMISQQNFAKSDGGSYFTFSKFAPGSSNASGSNDGKPKIPTPAQQDILRDLNDKQSQLDVAVRKLSSLRWDLFAEWFKFKSEFIEINDQKKRWEYYKDIVGPIKAEITALNNLVTSLQEKLTTVQGQVDCKKSTKDPYHKRTDPTLCIAGLDSGWALDVMDTLQVRADSELTNDAAHLAEVDSIFAATSSGRPKTSSPIPQSHGLQSTAQKILAECLKSENATTNNGRNLGDPKHPLLTQPLTITGFQAWGERNPYAPLFIEWESHYFDIKKEYWEVQVRPSPVGHAHSQVRYAPTQLLAADSKNAKDNQSDMRILSGRVLVLPQPRFSLQNIVSAVLDNKANATNLTDAAKAELEANIQQIKFISAPLSGLTNHLLTRCDGAHVKPNVRTQGKNVLALKAADASEIDMDYENTLPLVDAQSSLTPYGLLMPFGLDQYPHNPFKPVTQGQMVFTKINIIDKFGQAICLPPSNRRKVLELDPPDAKIYPCLSDYLAPDVIKAKPKDTTGILNTVFANPTQATDGVWPHCQYVQLTPSINQDARINGSFLMQDALNSPWREVSEYESPIWGWIIINYADSGLQFFLADGRFYRELRKGGVQGTNLSAKWLPYEAPAGGTGIAGLSPTDPAVAQLDQFFQNFTNDSTASYLLGFSDVINGAIQNMPFPPSSYAGYANAIVGKPLALVNVGWSIELAEPPIKPQFYSVDARTDMDQWIGELEAYTVPLKIGDYERSYDGVVGYYAGTTPEDPHSQDDPPPAPTTNWDPLYTYFMPESPNRKFTEITPDKYLQLHPYYIDPDPDTSPERKTGALPPKATPKTTFNMTSARCKKYTVTSIIMDPYTPIQGYSPMLPTKSLTLPPWTINTAMDKMHAFFRLGPVLLTNDVPYTYDQANATSDGNTPKEAVSLPVSGRKGTWNWLQPYAQDGFDAEGNDAVPKFAAMGVQEDLGVTKFEPAPYTFLEGYLQLMGRLDNKGGT